ncbi:MAG: hemerythrin domain-containing protein [Paludibacter sp.]|nr:hemerythrin domain-containing protein [Paludibacter sp.]
MTLTEELIQEHAKIDKVLNIMNRISEDIKTQKVFYADDVEDILKFILGFWDKCHCKKEEKVLFPALISEGVIEKNDLVSMMVEEHILGKNNLKEISSCIENCKIGNPFSCEKLAASLSTYVSMMQIHMENEEKIFFPLADRVLSKNKQDQALEQFEIIDKRLVKLRVYEQFQTKLERMELKYLNEPVRV